MRLFFMHKTIANEKKTNIFIKKCRKICKSSKKLPYLCHMISLARHIELLLLEHDCVIVPGLGGFIANHADARYTGGEEHLFLPPYRTIGFNQQLQVNDGLLVQSYMTAYDTSYPSANLQMEKDLGKMMYELEMKGEYELENIGTLKKGLNQNISFVAPETGALTPSLYGLSSFEMQPVAEVEQKQPVTPVITVVTPESDSTTKKVEEPLITVLDVEADETKKKENDPDTIVIKMSWVRNAVAVVAAAIVFFLIQTPVSNSNVINDVPQQSAVLHINKQQPVAYAEPKAEEPVVEAVETEEPAIEEEKKDEPAVEVKEEPAPIIEVVKEPVAEKKAEPKKVAEKKAEPKPVAEKKAEPKPVAEKKAEPKAVAEKKAEPKPVVEKKAEPKKEVKNYCIVLASQTARSLAEDFVAQIKKKGYTSARIVKMNNSEKVRVIYGSYQTESEVYNELNKMRKLDIFKDAWVLRP